MTLKHHLIIRTVLLWLALLWITLLSGALWACNAWQPQNLPQTPQDWQKEHQRLQPLFMACLSNADFLAYYGAIQLRTGRYNDALDTLERALLINPMHGAAQMDYAEALLFTGDPFAAQALNQQLMQDPSLPPLIQNQLRARQKQLGRLFNRWDHQLSASTGYDSNLNTAPDISELTITQGGQEWLLTLAPGSEPRSGGVLRLGMMSRYTRLAAHNRQSLQWGLNSRWSDHREDQQHQFTTRYQRQDQLLQGGKLQHELSLSALRLGDAHIYTALELQQHWQPPPNGQCQISPQHSLSFQDFPGRRHLNALEYRLLPEYHCHLPLGDLRLSAGPLLNHALDTSRAGGDRLGVEVSASWQQALGPGRLLLQARYNRWQDQKGYSALLRQDAKRNLDRQQLAVVYLLPLNASLLFTLQAAWQQQTSNLELFEYQSRQLDAGLRWQF